MQKLGRARARSIPIKTGLFGQKGYNQYDCSCGALCLCLFFSTLFTDKILSIREDIYFWFYNINDQESSEEENEDDRDDREE